MSNPSQSNQNPSSVAQALAKIRAEQNFGLATLAGVGAAICGAILWAIVTVVTNMQLGLIAVAVGYLVGKAVSIAGKGIDRKFGYLGAACGLLGCLLGNLLSAIAIFAHSRNLGAAEALGALNLDLLARLMTAFSKPMDLIFYGICIYEGYKFSFKYRLLKQPATDASAPGV